MCDIDPNDNRIFDGLFLCRRHWSGASGMGPRHFSSCVPPYQNNLPYGPCQVSLLPCAHVFFMCKKRSWHSVGFCHHHFVTVPLDFTGKVKFSTNNVMSREISWWFGLVQSFHPRCTSGCTVELLREVSCITSKTAARDTAILLLNCTIISL